jgi:hypothetical protein
MGATTPTSARSGQRGAVEPHLAIAGLAVVCLCLGLYATTLADAVGTPDRDVASATLSRVADAATTGGVVSPDRVRASRAAGPRGYHVAVGLRAGDYRRRFGPLPPGGTPVQRASRPVSVRFGPADVRPGTLRVEVWQ